MGFKDVFKKSFLEGFTSMDITTGKIAATLIETALLALYIFAIYRLVTRKVFYTKNFNISLAVMSLITAAIILAMQSNLVISLGMVGALSIVRFLQQSRILWIWRSCSGLSVLESSVVQVCMRSHWLLL